MRMSVDHCWTTPNLCTNGDVDLAKAFIFTNKWLVAQVYTQIWGPAPFVRLIQQSALSKEFTKFQIVLRTWNPSVKLEIHCAFIRSPINCICNIDFLWSKFPVTILYSLSSKVIEMMGVFDKLIQCPMPILSSIPSTCITPLHLFWAIVLLTIILLLFSVDVLKFCRYMVIGN